MMQVLNVCLFQSDIHFLKSLILDKKRLLFNKYSSNYLKFRIKIDNYVKYKKQFFDNKYTIIEVNKLHLTELFV